MQTIESMQNQSFENQSSGKIATAEIMQTTKKFSFLSRCIYTVARMYHYLVISSVVLILFLPLLAIFIYSFSTQWGATILPSGITFDWYITLFKDERFFEASMRSLFVCMMALLLSTFVILPVAFVIHYAAPKLQKWMNIIILIPFAMPPVVAAVGLLQIYSSTSLMGSPWILVLCYFMLALPFMYRTLSSSLSAINLHELLDACHLLGVTKWQAFFTVILPNIKKGVLTAWFICFGFMFGEFVFANMLVGTRYETLPVYLFNMRAKSGHFTSAIVITYFIFTLLVTLFAMKKVENRA